MSSTSKKNDLLKGELRPTLVRMTIPMIVGMIMLMTFSIVDTFFVSLIGVNELAAISFTFPVTFTVISLNIGLGIGASAVIGSQLGSGNDTKAKVLATGSIILAISMVGVLSVLGYSTIDLVFGLMGASDELLPLIHDYMSIWYISGVLLSVPMVGNAVLRASGDTKTPSIIMAVGGGINAALDPILIFGYFGLPAMGIQGAAIATCVAWGVCVIWIIYLLAVKRGLMEPRILSWQELKESSKGILAIGLPAAGSNMLTPISAAVVTAIVATYGAEAVAAWGVGSRLESMASIVVLALSMSLPPLISQNFGAQQFKRIFDAYKLCIQFVMVWQLVIFALLLTISPYIAAIFADDASVEKYIVLFLSIVPLGYGLQGIIILTNSSFNAMHKPITAVWLSIIRLFVCYIPFIAIGSYFFGLIGIFWACVLANVCAALVSYSWFNTALKEQKSMCENSSKHVTTASK